MCLSKKCLNCKEVKLLENFSKDKNRKDGLQNYCKLCNTEKSKLHSKINREFARKFCNKVKSRFGCFKCGLKEHYLLDFHHLVKTDKRNNVSILVAKTSGKPSIKKIKDEIRKCIILCANHHREFHYLELYNNITIKEYLNVQVVE